MKTGRIANAMEGIGDDLITAAGAEKKRPAWHRFGAAAACLLLVVGIGGALLRHPGNPTQSVTLGNGTLEFHRGGETVSQMLDIADIYARRSLTDAERQSLFGGAPVTAQVVSDSVSRSFAGLEGKWGEVSFTVTAPGVTLRDTVIEGGEEASQIGGVSVTAGYFTTAANSRGEKTAIYYADFLLGEYTVHMEHAGDANDADRVRNELAEAVGALIARGVPDLGQLI